MTHGTARRYVLEAFFDEPAPAHDAVLALEGQGIDADEITVVGADAVPTPDATREADLDATAHMARWAVRGALVGAVVGALLLAGAVLLLDVAEAVPWALVAAMCGAIAGSVVGGFWRVGTHLPVTEESFDTYSMETMHDAPVRVEVRVASGQAADEAAEVLWSLHPRRVERRGA